MEFKFCQVFRTALPTVFTAGSLTVLARGVETDTSQFGFLSPDQPGLTLPAALPQNPAQPLDPNSAGPENESQETPAAPRENSFSKRLRFGLAVQSLYDDNVFLSNDHKEGAWVNRVTPILRIGSTVPDSIWAMEAVYSPTWTTYASSSAKDSFDQAVAATLHYNGSRLKAAASASYLETSGNDRFVRDLFTTATTRGQLLLNYELSGRTSLESSIIWEKLDRQDTRNRIYNDDNTVSLQLSALWQATPISRIGPSVRIGSTSSTLSPDRTFVDGLLRWDYESSALLKFSAQAGMQWISFHGANGSTWRPSAALTGQYDLNPLWQLSMRAYSQSSPGPSVLNSDLQTTGINGTLRWRPSDILLVSAGAGYERASYEFFGTSDDRTDDYTYGELLVRIGRETSPAIIELFYRRRLSDSSASGQDFVNNQAGIQISRRF
jgi:hypothetical protein